MFRRKHRSTQDLHSEAEVYTAQALSLYEQYQRDGDPDVLQAALTQLRAAVEATPEGQPARVIYLSNLGIGLNALVNDTGSAEAMVEAFNVDLALANATADGDPERARRLFNVGQCLKDLFRAADDADLLLEAIKAGRAAVDAAQPDDPGLPDYLDSLGQSLFTAFEFAGDLELLREAAEVYRIAAAGSAADDPERNARLARLWAVLSPLGQQTGDLDILRETAEVCRELAKATASDDPDRVAYLANLSITLGKIGSRTDDLDVLRDAADVGREATAAAPDDDPRRVVVMANFWLTLYSVLKVTGDEDTLRELVAVGREVVLASGKDDPERVNRLTNFGMVAQQWYQRTGDLAALREAAGAYREALAVLGDQPDVDARRHTDLGQVLAELAEFTGDQDVLTEAVAVYRATLPLMPQAGATRAGILSNFGITLRRVYEGTGDRAALEESVMVSRDAVEMTSEGEPHYAACLANLGACLAALSDVTGDLDMLGEAVSVGRAALAATPHGDPAQTNHAASLGLALQAMFERTGDLDALASAISVERLALAVAPEGYPALAARLADLGNGLRLMFERTGDTDKLGEAVARYRAAVEVPQSSKHDQAICQSGLAGALRCLSGLFNNVDTLREAVTASRTAVSLTPDDHADLTAFLSNLGSLLLELFERTGETDALLEARSVLARGAGMLSAPVSARLRAGRMQAMADTQAGDHNSAADVMMAMVGLLPLIAPPQLRQQDRQHWLGASEAAGAGAQAAAAALSAGRPELAVSLLEQARGLLLAQAMGARGDDLAVLRERAPDLLPEFERLRDLLTDSGTPPHGTVGRDKGDEPTIHGKPARDAIIDFAVGQHLLAHLETPADPDTGVVDTGVLDTDADGWPAGYPKTAVVLSGEGGWRIEGLTRWHVPTLDALKAAGQRRELAGAWDGLLRQIRARPGLGEFLAPPPVSLLLKQAAAGPVVIVTAYQQRGDALILTSAPSPRIVHVPLPKLTSTAVAGQVSLWRAALDAATRTDASISARQDAQHELQTLLGWLWDTIAAPVMDALGYHSTPEPGGRWPRLWWCPVGNITYLPLHAAGHHGDLANSAASPRTVLDRVISSYTSTVRALGYARRQAATGSQAQETTLIVAASDVPGAPVLAGVDEEIRQLCELLPDAVVLQDGDATYHKVMSALPAHRAGHFACHSLSSWDDPGASQLMLRDHRTHPLTVRDIIQSQFIDGELAYLSACSTTNTSPDLTDEAVHMTGAFQFAGYRHVIGTLWPVNDAVAARIAVELYSDLTSHGRHQPDSTRAAIALHTAVRRLRSEYPATPTRWSGYLHAGA